MDKDRERTNPKESDAETPKKPAHQVTLDIYLDVINHERRNTTPHLSGHSPAVITTCEKILSSSIIPQEELPDILSSLVEIQTHLYKGGKEAELIMSIQTIIDSQTPQSTD